MYYCNSLYILIDHESSIPKPKAPNVVEVGYRTIQLRFITTELKNRTNISYVLEVKPQFGPQDKGDRFVVFPFIKKYYYVSRKGPYKAKTFAYVG